MKLEAVRQRLPLAISAINLQSTQCAGNSGRAEQRGELFFEHSSDGAIARAVFFEVDSEERHFVRRQPIECIPDVLSLACEQAICLVPHGARYKIPIRFARSCYEKRGQAFACGDRGGRRIVC
jgi:hypothetical protein